MMTRDQWVTLATNGAVAVLFALPFIGLGMGLWTNNGNWFYLCALIILFLS